MCHFNTWLLGTIYCYLLLLPQKKINKCLFIYLILYSLNIFAIEMSHWRMFTTANLLVWIPMESTVVQFCKLMTSIRLFFPPTPLGLSKHYSLLCKHHQREKRVCCSKQNYVIPHCCIFFQLSSSDTCDPSLSPRSLGESCWLTLDRD